MMNTETKFKTEQEDFWAGSFGTEYIQRNQGDALLASNLNFFSRALHAGRGIQTYIEFGANIGMNLKALKLLHPSLELHGIEINSDAALELSQVIPPPMFTIPPSWNSNHNGLGISYL
jgi:spore coat polysaccharide biosynthesis protein SpsF